MSYTDDFDDFPAAIVNVIALRRERHAALPLPDLQLQAELEDLEAEYLALVSGTTSADKAEIGELYREALKAFGSNEEIFAQYPDVAGLLLTLRIEGAIRLAREMLQLY